MRLKEVSVGGFFHLSENHHDFIGRNTTYIRTNIKSGPGIVTVVDTQTGFFLDLNDFEDVFLLKSVEDVALSSLAVGDLFIFEDQIMRMSNKHGKNGNIPVSLITGYSYGVLPATTIVKKFNIFNGDR